MQKQNIDNILDMILNSLLILTALLSFAVCGRNLARVLIEFNTGEYGLMVLDLIFAIWLFALGFRNAKAAWKYFRTRFER